MFYAGAGHAGSGLGDERGGLGGGGGSGRLGVGGPESLVGNMYRAAARVADRDDLGKGTRWRFPESAALIGDGGGPLGRDGRVALSCDPTLVQVLPSPPPLPTHPCALSSPMLQSSAACVHGTDPLKIKCRYPRLPPLLREQEDMDLGLLPDLRANLFVLIELTMLIKRPRALRARRLRHDLGEVTVGF
jgi:hypothetical protein